MNVWLLISIAAKHSETAALKDLTLTVSVASGHVSCLPATFMVSVQVAPRQGSLFVPI